MVSTHILRIPPRAMVVLRRLARARLLRGQSLVEFALVLPILLLLIGGAVDLGRLFYAQIAISNAAKEGAFFGATSPGCAEPGSGCTDPRTVSWHVEQETIGLSAVSHTTECLHAGAPVSLASCQEDDVYEVGVSYTFSLATPILSGIFGGAIPLHASATSVVLNQTFDSSATPVPGSSTTPSPTPSAGTCVVPDFVGTRANDAAGTWSVAGFSGGVTTSGSGNFTINSQSLTASSTQPCSSGITVSSSAATPTPAPTATPTPAGTPTPTATPTATPSCQVVPNLVGMTVSQARAAWTGAGFTGSFTPANGQTNKTVTNQVTSPASAPGQCIAASASVTVTYQ